MDPCKQEGRLGEISQAIRFFQEAEERREQREQRMLLAMETVAKQGEILKNHAESLSRQEKAQEEVFRRLRTIELMPGQVMSKAAIVMLTAGCGSVGGVVTAMVMWAVKGQ